MKIAEKKVFREISTLAQSHGGDTAFCVWLTAAGTLLECRCDSMLLVVIKNKDPTNF